MFDKIPFYTTTTDHRLSSKRITYENATDARYNSAAIANANFSMLGSVDAFLRPPVSEFALSNLYYLEDFDRFYYKKSSYTERWNFCSFLIAYTYSGTGLLRYGEKEYLLQEGDGFYIDCRQYHYYAAVSDTWDVAIMHLGGVLLPSQHAQFMQFSSPVFHDPLPGTIQDYFEELLTLYSKPHSCRDWLASDCISSLLTFLLKKQADESDRDSSLPDNIRFLVKYMENHFSEPLSLDFLADFAGVSKYYMSREFKRYTGFSPNDYLITLRINRAKFLLTGTTLPAVKIAHEVGIHDPNNFTNLFKQKTGFTPIQYRKTHIV